MTVEQEHSLPRDLHRPIRFGLGVMLLLSLVAGCGDPQPTTQPTGGPRDQLVAKTDRVPPPEAAPSEGPAELNDLPGRVHIVQPGETLYSITTKYYGDGRQWRRILVANRNRLADPKDLRTGMKLIIP